MPTQDKTVAAEHELKEAIYALNRARQHCIDTGQTALTALLTEQRDSLWAIGVGVYGWSG